MLAFDEIFHEDHPNHKLKLKHEETPYKCNVCKELGLHTRYACEVASCDFHLHVGCVEPAPTLQHDFYGSCNFFYVKEGMPRKVCDACGKGLDRGSPIYHCYDKGKDLHPSCARLERFIQDGVMDLRLRKEMPVKCRLCGQKKLNGKKTWGYVSTTHEDCSVHIACMKKQIVEVWLKRLKQQRTFGTSSERRSAGANDDDESGGADRALVRRTPMLQLALDEETKKAAASGKSAKYRKMAQIAITFIIAAVLGEPTAIITSLICGLLHH